MPPPGIKKPTLPQHLLKELGVADPKPGAKRPGANTQVLSRKERRKAERQQARVARSGAARQQHHSEPPSKSSPLKSKPAGKPPAEKKTNGDHSTIKEKPSPKKRRPEPEDEEDESLDDFEDFGRDDVEDDDEEEDEDMLSDGILDEGSDDDDDGDEPGSSDNDADSPDDAPPPRKIPKAVKEKLAKDDAEIAEYERKLGLRGRKNLPKSFKEDGLADLLEGLDSITGGSEEKRKRKAEADEWLAQKRRKAEAEAEKKAGKASKAQKKGKEVEESEEEGGSDEEMDDFGSEDGFEDDEDDDGEEEDMDGESQDVDGDGFEGFDSDGEGVEEEPPQKRVRENPYVAPTTGRIAKYVPPSLRKDTGSDSELAARVRRQTQGLVNRITEANLLTIVGEVEKLYRENPRQHVTSALVDLLLIQVCDSTTLPDTLLILSAGFATAAYMTLGTDFGGQLVQETVERFQKFYEEAKAIAQERPDVPKQTSNLITFISQLYTFQLIGPNLVFDYIRMLLDDLSELNAELLLRIVRMCGPTLRQDDPMALKDIVALIPPAVAKVGGEKKLSVRTRFMIDTITDLKNNKLKAGVGASALVAEHITRMKKLLGQLKAKSIKSSEPMRMGLKDIQDADKKGKWWLVGASWAGRSADDKAQNSTAKNDESDDSDSDGSIALGDLSFTNGPDLAELAREQGMNTDVRRSIFVSVMSALDYQDAFHRILKLRLNKERQREIPTVLMRCVAAEQHYNPYYTLVAKRACAEYREVRWAFQAGLWKMFARMGERGLDDDDDEGGLEEEEEEDPVEGMRKIVNTAKMFGTLVAAGSLSLTGVLKRLNLLYLQKKTRDFVEIMLVTTLLELCQPQQQEGGQSNKGEEAIAKVFGGVADTAPDLARGLQYFLKKVVRKSDLAGGKKETKRLREGCMMAEAVVQASLARAEGLE
ncbi:hypothetical protein VTJ04DRAFT_10685 [Mycothermus thermophilus]|uniref:uncharacterized protein n=1 Tax=Humicola insolens TaxID=85995 RepID=UPI003742F85C